MFGSLYGKLIAVLIAFALIMVAVFALIMSYSATARRQEVSQRVYRTYASQLVKERVFPDGHLDPSAFEQVFDYLRVVNPRFDAYLIDANGAILATSSKAGALKHKSVDMRPIRDFLAEDPALPILGDDPADGRIRRVFTATRLGLEPHGEAYLYLVIKGTRGDSAAQPILDSYVLRENAMLVGGGLALALLASALIIGLLTRRLQRLARVMDRFRETGFAGEPAGGAARAERGDEIDRLAGTFNAMADRILAQMRELRQTDSMRRELVANISHDLRTPLASLRGHLETLQSKGDRLTEEEKRGYLEIALRQSEQLSHLVAGLFELAKLDSERPAVLPEPFVLTDLVQDILQQFELAASQKQIRIAADLPLEMPLVVGDIGLIERALRNLIENSLRYTPAGGEITVAVTAGQARATAQVTDSGCGIDAADLPRIFDRFYRGEKSRSDASGSAGLGLAIAKRILELHDSTLTVASEPGRTAIGFTLAYAGGRDVSSGAGDRPEPEAAGNATIGPAAVPAALKPLGGLGPN
ncbi:MAG: HAMP domain-containing protein [Betaproteobacteria bacterium]|nr:HAMP domain-containing protein [Betaproteobacteria bacterium]